MNASAMYLVLVFYVLLSGSVAVLEADAQAIEADSYARPNAPEPMPQTVDADHSPPVEGCQAQPDGVVVACLHTPPVGQSAIQHVRPNAQTKEINERMILYKRIKFEQNKKALMQLLHDIADIQKQCRDKGYLCSVEGGNAYESFSIDPNQIAPAQQAGATALTSHTKRMLVPNLRLLGIVGGRARFRLEDGRIKDFSPGESITDFWKVAEIGIDTALLVSKRQPEMEARYQIHKEVPAKDTEENTTEAAQ